MRLLLIEDDVETASFIVDGLASEGHDLIVVGEGRGGMVAALDGPFDIILADRMLPDMDGVEMIAAIRAAGIRTPVLMLTALGSIQDRVAGLHGGADDYLVKPFAMAELSARIAALARRAGDVPIENSVCGTLRIDRMRRDVWREDRRIIVQPREFELLEQLMAQAEQVVSRAMLLEKVWHFHFDPQTNIVETHMSRLRQKLNAGFDKDVIQTVRGVGYRLHSDV